MYENQEVIFNTQSCISYRQQLQVLRGAVLDSWKKENVFEYKLVGFGASADGLLNEIFTQGRRVKRQSLNRFLEKLSYGQYSEESAGIIHGRSLSS